MSGDELAAYVDDLVHEETQVTEAGVDLTVADVYEVAGAGRVDFGGSELAEAALEACETWRRTEGDDYGWWQLDAGQYVLSHNERLAPPEGTRLVVQTRTELLARGAFHPTLHAADLDAVPLSVGGDGVALKENARVSTVVRAETD